MAGWYDDDELLEGAVKDGILRSMIVPPAIPGCEQLEEIGRGGQGVVYRAIQSATRRAVAVKLLLDAPGRTRTNRMRFEREVEIVAGLRDPRLVQVFSGGETDDGRPFVVMELVDGVPVDRAPAVGEARASGFARPAADRSIALFAEICDGLDHAHRNGVIHRDIKPHNVLVDGKGVPRILDFGLAKAAAVDGSAAALVTSVAGRFLGSLPWASPEQAEGRSASVDVRSDVYAIGATLYHVVTGQPPVRIETDLRRMLDAIVNEAPMAPSHLDRRCDRDLEAVILRALEKDPARRYATAGEVAKDLRRILAGEPTEARRENAWRALVKLARRRRRVAIVSGVVAVLAVAVFVVTSWSWRRAVAESERALAESRRAEAALDFFLDAIGMVDPGREGANTRLTDALDRVSAEIDRRFPEQDGNTRLRFRMRLRDLYLRLGRFDRGLAEAEAVSALTRAVDPRPGSKEFRSCWNGETTRAFALYRVGRADEALALFQQAQRRLEAAFGARDRDALAALAKTAQVLRAAGRLDEAEEALRRVVHATEGATGVEEAMVTRAFAFDNLAAIAEARGAPAQAEAPQREAVRLFAAAKGQDAFECLLARSNLGNLLLTLGRPAEAVEVLVPVAAGFRDRSGAKSPMALAAAHNLGVALRRAGKPGDGERVLQEVYDARLAVLGAAAHDTLLTLNELAVAAGARGDRKENERLLRMLVEARRGVRETPPVSYWNAVSNLAIVLIDDGRAQEAAELFDEIRPVVREGLGSDHWLAAWIEGNWGRCLSGLGRVDEASESLAASVAVLEKRLGPDHENTAIMKDNLARNRSIRSGEGAAPISRPASRGAPKPER